MRMRRQPSTKRFGCVQFEMADAWLNIRVCADARAVWAEQGRQPVLGDGVVPWQVGIRGSLTHAGKTERGMPAVARLVARERHRNARGKVPGRDGSNVFLVDSPQTSGNRTGIVHHSPGGVEAQQFRHVGDRPVVAVYAAHGRRTRVGALHHRNDTPITGPVCYTSAYAKYRKTCTGIVLLD